MIEALFFNLMDGVQIRLARRLPRQWKNHQQHDEYR
jgi:hypothetical protein